MTSAYSGSHKRRRAEAIAALEPGTPCPGGCGGYGMYQNPNQALVFGAPRWCGDLDLDHVVPIILGGADGAVRIMHSRCNRRLGQRIGAMRRGAGQPAARPSRPRKPKHDRW